MRKDFSGRNLQRRSFKGENLSFARFYDADLRGADFTGADLRGADFNHVKTGITPDNTFVIFLAALAVSLFSGYVAMLAGHTLQLMLVSQDGKIRFAGIATIVIVLLFLFYAAWKGGRSAIRHLLLPAVGTALVVAVIAFLFGLGTGRGMLYQALALLLTLVMFVVGTVARAVAGSLSSIIFLVVALSGGIFGRSVGGGVGTIVMALACAYISKKALSGAGGFDTLRKIAFYITSHYGTSFRSSRLREADFSRASIHNADFSHADTEEVNWSDAEKINCITTSSTFHEK